MAKNMDSNEMLMHAVRGMLPKNSLGRAMIKKLRVYKGSEHENQAQKPEVYEFSGGNIDG
jgi:large subunit ribosomal protein L13